MDNKEPAFPIVYAEGDFDRGMTLRDYFAAAAMPLMYKFWMEDYYHPDNECAENRTNGRTDINPEVMKLISDHAYVLAEEMMRSRNLL